MVVVVVVATAAAVTVVIIVVAAAVVVVLPPPRRLPLERHVIPECHSITSLYAYDDGFSLLFDI